jgi:hypothetical protein
MVQERNVTSAVGAASAFAYSIYANQIIFYPRPANGQVYKHIYVPQPPNFLLTSAPTSTTVDLVTPDGENFVTWGVAVLGLAKSESDTQVAQMERERARARVEEWSMLRALNTPRRPVLDEHRWYDPGEYWPR